MSRNTDGLKGRRKSLGIFPRPDLKGLTPAVEKEPSEQDSKQKQRPSSFLTPLRKSQSDNSNSESSDGRPESPRIRPRTLLKSSRPSSIFGSLRSRHSGEEEEKLTGGQSAVSSYDQDGTHASNVSGKVLHHGEVQTTGGMFRKRKEYLVLTDTHLVRFKSRAKAQEAFPSIPGSLGRNYSGRHPSIASTTAVHDVQSIATQSSTEPAKLGTPLNQIVAIYRVEDGRPTFTIEVASLDEDIYHASSLLLQISDPREADLWLSSLRAASTKARLVDPAPFPRMCIEYVARRLEQERDYDREHFKMFKVVHRASNKSMGRSSSDDLSKLNSSIRYLAIGAHKIHLINVQEASHRSSTTNLTELPARSSYGLMTLFTMAARSTDDSFELCFRLPLQPTVTVSLASACSTDIVIYIRQMNEYLRPEWLEQSYKFSGPLHLREAPAALPDTPGEHKSFDRTLIAYCAAYNVDTSNICYAVRYDVEDGPAIFLLPPASMQRRNYSLLELLAFFRALRYNESFRTISFSGINLEVLHQLYDRHGYEHLVWATRTGLPISSDPESVSKHTNKSLLIQEVQALCVTSRKLRRLDFAFSITRRPSDDADDGGNGTDPGCELCEAVFPLCRKQLTNVDWIVLNGIELGETDLDYLVDAAVQRVCHLRALEVSRCNLSDRSLGLILNAMLSQDSTLESIDISGNLARLSPSIFQGQIGHFGLIRKLNLSRVQRTAGPEPLVAPETLLTWRLEELHLSQTPINEQTVDSISAYLASNMSDTLRELHLNQCGLSGRDLAVFMHSMPRQNGKARNLHLFVSENRLEKNHDEFVDAVAKNMTPTHLTMEMVEYQKEEHFRQLIQALQSNTTLIYLDISKASLPYDANEDTCEALQQMFACNKTLEVLDISGEHAHLEVAKFGIGLNHALTGLKHNTALRALHIEYQKLGMQGANTLSSVLESNNTLREIYCEHNDINLQGLTVLVNALQNNHTVLYLPAMTDERIGSLQSLQREIEDVRGDAKATSGAKATNTIRRGLAAVKSASASKTNILEKATSSTHHLADQDLQEVMREMNDKWDRQVQRLDRYLLRNYNLAHGLPALADGIVSDDEDNDDNGEDTQRPPTATSLGNMLDKVKLGTLPRDEKGNFFLGDIVSEKLGFDPENEGKDKENYGL